jgi:putative redox protein
MASLTTKLTWNNELQFTGQQAEGFATLIDGNTTAGPSPMELLLEAVGGCSAIDVVLILQKMREPLARLEVALEGERAETQPRYFTSITARFDVWGDGLNAEKVARSVNLSFARYCSVFHSLRKDLQLTAQFRLHAAQAEAAGEYQTVEITSE